MQVPFAHRPGLIGPSAGQASCTDPAQLQIMANISTATGVLGFSFHSYPARVGPPPDSLARFLLNASWLRTGILRDAEASHCVQACESLAFHSHACSCDARAISCAGCLHRTEVISVPVSIPMCAVAR